MEKRKGKMNEGMKEENKKGRIGRERNERKEIWEEKNDKGKRG